jgi:NAD(P)H-quinone oxidoreductase subunit 5
MNGNWTDIAFLAIPLAYLLAAAVAGLTRPGAGWRILQAGNALALGLALTLPLLAAPVSGYFQHGAVNLTVLGLVAFIGLIVVRFSTRYLEGDAGQARFQRWLQVTLACVSVVVTSNHFAILVVAWVTISLSLHQLLMFYPGRKRAVLAAHKKFLFARVAELCLAGAGALLYLEHGTLLISELLAPYAAGAALSLNAQLAALLIASAAMVKCAQFPMHGWLIQVVEAPTPVSALLHAGIVNLGGYLLIMLAPLMSQAAIANWLLLIVAGLTCVAAALITMTRVSIKVLLAWSTVAQMGLMLVECALGLYGLALLHLVAHSCYKAYSFLAAGSQVESYLLQQLARPQAPGRLAVPGLFLAFAALVILAEGVFEVPLAAGTGPWILFCLLPVILISERRSVLGASALPTMVAIAAGLGVAYAVQKSLFVTFAPTVTMATAAQTLWCILLVGMLLGAYWLLRQHGHSALARRLYRNLYAGFYLDEWSTRITLALWPAQLPPYAAHRRHAGIDSLDTEHAS